MLSSKKESHEKNLAMEWITMKIKMKHITGMDILDFCHVDTLTRYKCINLP